MSNRQDFCHRRRALFLVAVACVPLLYPAGASVPDHLRFRDIAKQAGITSVIISGSPKKNYVLEVNGSGVCWFDYDNDGYVDLYLVNGSTLEALQGKTLRPVTNHLYRNNGDGTFSDVTEKA